MLIDFRTLFPKYNINPKGVLHIGANVGEERDVYLQLGIKKQIWIEANPEIFEKLKINVSNNNQAICFCSAVGDYDGQINLHVSNNGSQSSSILELGTHKIAHPEVNYIKDIEVKIRKIETLIPTLYLDRDYDLLNIDIQGAELKALKGMGKLLHQFKWAYLEVNKEELYKGCALVDDIDFYLGAYGFTRVETMWCGNTGWGDALYIKQ